MWGRGGERVAGRDRQTRRRAGRASGVPAVVDAVAHDYRRARSPREAGCSRDGSRVCARTLRRLRLDRDTSPSIDTDIRRAVGAFLPAPQATPAARAAVDLAAWRLADAAADGLPRRWAEAVAAVALPPQERLADELDQAIVRTRLRGRQPVWWTVVRLLQWVFALITLVGLAWSLVQLLLGTGGLIQLPSIYVGPVSLPLVLLVGGLLAGWLLALLSRWFAEVPDLAGRPGPRAAGSMRRSRASPPDSSSVLSPMCSTVTA